MLDFRISNFDFRIRPSFHRFPSLRDRECSVVAPNAFGDGAGPESLRGHSLLDTERSDRSCGTCVAAGASQLLRCTSFQILLVRISILNFEDCRSDYRQTAVIYSIRRKNPYEEK